MTAGRGSKPPGRTRDLGILVGVVALVLGALWVAVAMAGLAADRDRLEREVSSLSDQVRGLGGTPVVTPQPGSPGSPGSPGPAGGAGPPGVTGASGPPGATITGPPGPSGGKGDKGDTGTPGESVTGPPGPAGADGEDGVNGKDGADGKDGGQGPPGPACPDGYTTKTTTVITQDGPQDVALCTKDG